MKIIVDVMGSDKGCAEMTQGVCDAVEEYKIEAVAVGNAAEMAPIVEQRGLSEKIRIVDAPDFISMDDDSALVRTSKSGSSMVVGMKALAAGEGDAFVTAGSTGAAITAATLYVKRIRGIRRASLAPTIPTLEGGAILIDCGANADCTPEYLLQFAYMGSYYASVELGKDSPRVALLNNGTEKTKGDELRQQTYALLEAAGAEGRINFVGNIEGRDVLYGGADVIVADGFSGNILLKSVEGTAMFLMGQIKSALTKSLKSKIGALLVKKDIYAIKKMMNYKEIGGSPLVGVKAPVIKAHGSADAYTMKNAIARAVRFAEGGIVGKISDNVELMKLPSGSAE